MATKQPEQKPKFLTMHAPEVPPLMSNVVSLFIQGIPQDSYSECGIAKKPPLPPEQVREKLADFVRDRLKALAAFEYASWINGRIPFVTSRELQLWRLLQFVKFLWFWDLPDDAILAEIFNATVRKASNLASDFEARFRKTILYPVALRRLYELFNTQPAKATEPHPRKKAWDGCVYRVDSDRYLGYTVTFISDLREFANQPLVDACWWDKDEKLMWVPLEVREIAVREHALREKLFEMYRLPSDDTGG
jgi:hypothetical protein